MLGQVTASQWGMVTTAQAASLGVSRLALARAAEAGHLIRLTQGVYREAGAPADEFEDLRAGWLATDPTRTAEDRLSEGSAGVVVSGVSAAWLHKMGICFRSPTSSPPLSVDNRSEPASTSAFAISTMTR